MSMTEEICNKKAKALAAELNKLYAIDKWQPRIRFTNKWGYSAELNTMRVQEAEDPSDVAFTCYISNHNDNILAVGQGNDLKLAVHNALNEAKYYINMLKAGYDLNLASLKLSKHE